MKIDRYEMYTRFDGSVELVIDLDGSVCYTRDVEKLEALNAELLEALRGLAAVAGLAPIKGNLEALQEAYDIAWAAIAKAKEGNHS